MNTCCVKTDVQIDLSSSSRNEMGPHYQEMWAKVLRMQKKTPATCQKMYVWANWTRVTPNALIVNIKGPSFGSGVLTDLEIHCENGIK